MKPGTAVKNYYVLPCLLLLLNLANSAISYKAQRIGDIWLRTATVIGLVLFGGSLTAFLLAPALERLVAAVRKSSRAGAGSLGEWIALAALGAAVFWLYYQLTAHGIASLLPAGWRNPPGR